jgi:hypothetical protein
MKVRHTTAIGAFVLARCAAVSDTGSSSGWILLIPPLTSGVADTAKPLSNWRTLGNFSSSIDCNSWMTRQQFSARAQFGPITKAQGYYQAQPVEILNGQCVSTADPRLTGK